MLTLLIIGVLLSVLPAQTGAIRLAGVSVSWWYAIVLAPGVAVVVGFVLGMSVPVHLTLWVAPASFSMVATQIFVATPGAPLIALAVMLVPMMAGFIRVPDAAFLPRPLAAGLLTASVALVAWANFLIVADGARGLGLERWYGLALTAPIAVALAWRGDARWRLPVVVASTGLLALVAVTVGVASGLTPWRAWSRLASRPIVAFADSSAWVTQGRTLSTPTRVTLTEAQRMTATSIATWRIVPGDGSDAAPFEWRMVPGDSLALQSGDEVLLPSGAGVRFESGRRVPGAPLSGVVWADATPPSALGGLLGTVGAALTLVGGGVVLMASRSPTRASARWRFLLVASAYAVVLLAVCSGVYAADVGVDLALGGSAAVAIMRLPSVAVSGASGAVLTVVTGVAIIGLMMAAVTTLADRAAGAWSIVPIHHASVVRAGVVTSAALLALAPATAWNVLMLGLGLAAAGVGPTLLDAPPLLRLIASVTGALAIVSLALADPWLAPIASVLCVYPALLAIPLAAGITWIGCAQRG